MSAAHTPGPWHIADHQNLRDISIRNGSPNQRLAGFAKVRKRCWSDGKFEWDTQSEDEANARLIAAAPELLEALQRVLHYLNDRSDVDYRGGEPYPNAENQMLVALGDRIEAAIAKATGSAS